MAFYHLICKNVPAFFNIMSFMMAPFYVASGFFFSNKKDIKMYVGGKMKSLMIPYLFYSVFGYIIFLIYNILLHNYGGFLSPFKSLLTIAAVSTNAPTWFLFSLFMVTTIYCVANKYLKFKYLNIFILCCIVFAYLVNGRIQVLGYGNIALGLFFYHLGYLFHIYNGERVLMKYLYFIFAVLIFAIINYIQPQNLAFYIDFLRSGNYFINILFSILGCYIFLFLCLKFNYFPLLNLIGEYSLSLFALHCIILNYFYNPLIKIIWPQVPYLIYIGLGLLCILLIYYVFVLFVKSKAPILIVGGSLKNKKFL